MDDCEEDTKTSSTLFKEIYTGINTSDGASKLLTAY